MNQKQEYLKYLLGRKEWTKTEKEWMLDYLNGNDLSDLEMVAAEEYNADLEEMKSILDRRLSEDLLHKIHQRIQPPVRPARTLPFRWIAAAMVIILGGALYFLLSGGNASPGDYAVHITTGPAERKSIRLPDGSQVSLQPGSTLRYPEKFAGRKREVRLTGEAFFDVKHNEAHPFIVHADHIHTTVMGTAFNVEARADKDVKVVVVAGTVKVETADATNGSEAVVINRNQGAIYDKESKKLDKEELPADARYLEQREKGRFVYNGDAVKKVIEDMKRYYNTSIVLRDELQTCPFNGYISTSDNLDKALQLISVSLGAKVTIDSTAGSYIISGGSCE